MPAVSLSPFLSRNVLIYAGEREAPNRPVPFCFGWFGSKSGSNVRGMFRAAAMPHEKRHRRLGRVEHPHRLDLAASPGGRRR
jgi:hypothetical protein